MLTETLSNGKNVSQSLKNEETKTTEPRLQSLEPLQKSALVVRDDTEGQNNLARELYDRFQAMKTYGKEPESLKSIVSIFIRDLADYPTEKVLKAISTHAKYSQEFPTVADISGLIRRNGKPQIKESDIIAINKKDGQDRTRDEWQMLRDWSDERSTGWRDEPDPVKDAAMLADNQRLRQEINDLKAEIRRLGALALEKRAAKLNPPPIRILEISKEQRAINTILAMREEKIPESDIMEFAAPFGGLESLGINSA